MRPYILLVVIGVLVAGLAALVVRNTVPAPAGNEQAAAPVQTVKVLVAKDTIPVGTFVRGDSQLVWGEWPAEQVANSPYITQENGSGFENYNGAVARRNIFAGEPLTLSAIVKPGEGGFMSAVLGAGKRAVSIPVNATTGNAGFIFPGDAVDLVLTHSIDREQGGSTFASETIVQNVRVLAVDQMLNNPENKAMLAKTVTIEASPREVETITLALEMGKISVSLRGLIAEEETPAAEETTQPVILGQPAEVSPGTIDYFYPDEGTGSYPQYTRDSDISRLLNTNANSEIRKVRVIRGKESSDLEFRKGN